MSSVEPSVGKVSGFHSGGCSGIGLKWDVRTAGRRNQFVSLIELIADPCGIFEFLAVVNRIRPVSKDGDRNRGLFYLCWTSAYRLRRLP